MPFLPPNVDNDQSGMSYVNPILAALSGGAPASQPAPAAAPSPAAATPAPAGGGLLSHLFGGGASNPMGNPIGNALMGHGNFLVPLLAGLLGGKTPEQQRLAAAQAAATASGQAEAAGFAGLDQALQQAKGNHNRAIHIWMQTPAGMNYFVHAGKDGMSAVKTYMDTATQAPLVTAPGSVLRDPNDPTKIIAQNAPAGPSVVNTNNITGETKENQTLGEGFGKKYFTITDAGAQAIAKNQQLDAMSSLVKDPSTYQGAGQGLINAGKQIAVAFGLADPSTVASAEAANSMFKKGVFDMASGHLGTGFSEGDRQMLEGIAPNLGNTPAGNALLIGILKRENQRAIEYGVAARAYAMAHMDSTHPYGHLDPKFDQEWATYQQEHPMFPKGWVTQDGVFAGLNNVDPALLDMGTDQHGGYIGPKGADVASLTAGVTASAPQGGSAPASSAPAGNPVYAVNPKTGARLMLQGDKWVPVK